MRRRLPKSTAAKSSFSDSELKDVVDELYVDDAVDIVEEMPANVVKRILRQADPDMRKMINEILKYPDDCAGSIMTTEYVNFKPDLTVAEAIKHIRRSGLDKETVYTCYVTSKSRTLIGIVSIQRLLMAEDEELIEEIMDTNVISANTLDDREDVANLLAKYDLFALPVVDREARLVGIITVDDAIDVIKEEATEDIEIMAAITPSDKPYLKLGVWELWKQRIPWLLILMVSAALTGGIMSTFEAALASCIALTAFIPMLMNTGGNSGGQTSVTVIRSLSLGDIEPADIFKIVFKELRVSILCGIVLSAVNFVKILIFDAARIAASGESVVLVGLVVSISLFVTVFFANIVGAILPIGAKKIGFDPAVMSSPFITTIVDAVSLLIYFWVAGALLN